MRRRHARPERLLSARALEGRFQRASRRDDRNPTSPHPLRGPFASMEL